MNKLLPITFVVAGAAVFGGKFWIDDYARSIFEQNLTELTSDIPGLTITTADVSYNPMTKVMRAERLNITHENLKTTASIDAFSYLFIDHVNPALDDSAFQIQGLKIKLDETDIHTTEHKNIVKHLAGQDGIIEISAANQTDIQAENNRAFHQVKFDIENLAEVNISFNLDGFYNAYKLMVENQMGSIVEQQNSLGLLAQGQLNDLAIQIDSKGFAALFDTLMINHFQSQPHDAIDEINYFSSQLAQQEQNAELAQHITDIVGNYQQKQDVKLNIKFNSVINQMKVVSLLMSEQGFDYNKFKQDFGVNLTTEAH